MIEIKKKEKKENGKIVDTYQAVKLDLGSK